MRSRAWLKKWAVDYRAGLIFTSDMLGANVDLARVVFMPLAFMDDEQHRRFKRKRIGLIYGYYRDSMPRTVNGYPMLHTVGFLSPRERVIVAELAEELRQAEEAV